MGKMEIIPQRGEVLFLQSSVLCMRQYLGSSYQEIIGEIHGTEFLAETAACKGGKTCG